MDWTGFRELATEYYFSMDDDSLRAKVSEAVEESMDWGSGLQEEGFKHVFNAR
jgi:hypothetical protein